MSNYTNIAPELTAIISAAEFTKKVDEKQNALVTAAEMAADKWMKEVLPPAIQKAINSASVSYRPTAISVKFEGQELAGHDAQTMQTHIKCVLQQKGYSCVEFKDNKLTFSVKK